MPKQQKRIVTTRNWDHIETNTFLWNFEKISEDVWRFISAYGHEVVSIVRDFG